MVNIIKEELPIEESLKRKLELICEFSKTTPTIINGNIRKIDRTNLSYIEPHNREPDRLRISHTQRNGEGPRFDLL